MPHNPPISCGDPDDPTCLLAGCQDDEIAHAALIPSGAWPLASPEQTQSIAGMVLVWTRCDKRSAYTTHVWDPANPSSVAYSPPIIDEINSCPAPNPAGQDGPFCAGHAWILDDAKNPKLLTVGGQDRDDMNSSTCEGFEDQDGNPANGITHPCVGTGRGKCGLHKVYWFDPLVTLPQNAWSDTPPDLSDGRWYPSVTTSLDASESQFLPMVLGGNPQGAALGCGPDFQFSSWWTLDRPLTGPWTSHSSDPYLWHYYPRPLQISGPSILTAGSVILCEDEGIPTPQGVIPAGQNPFGGNPTSIISAAQTWSFGLSPNPHDTTLVDATAGGWNYSNDAILHTLKTLTYTEIDPEDNYDLDRVLVTGGSQQREVIGADNPFSAPAQTYTHEYHGGEWLVKAPAFEPRVYSNWVILPDGNLLLVGGADTNAFYNAVKYFDTVERFTPQGPLDPGEWKQMAPRPGVDTGGGNLVAPARGYHSIALLLQDGRVAVMGGLRPATPEFNPLAIVPWSKIEIYNPSYTFQSQRLKINAQQATPMAYGTPYYVTVNSPPRVDYACLIGVSSVTHSFDYGQRYVQLMATQTSGAGNIKVLGPPIKTMAPEGYYLLFVVEIRNGVHIPSKGVFVKLTI